MTDNNMADRDDQQDFWRRNLTFAQAKAELMRQKQTSSMKLDPAILAWKSDAGDEDPEISDDESTE